MRNFGLDARKTTPVSAVQQFGIIGWAATGGGLAALGFIFTVVCLWK
jgi:hypothetical protein